LAKKPRGVCVCATAIWPHLQFDAHGSETSDDRLAHREVGQKLVQLAGIKPLG
jgi:hypothetical protein